MKSTKVFFLWIVVLCVCLFAFDWVKGFVFSEYHHLLLIRLKFVVLVFGGIALMKYSLDINSFKRFIIFYMAIFVLYFVLKLIIEKEPGIFQSLHTDTNGLLLNYENFTQLFTPLPLIFFWIVNKTFLIEKKNES
jgi:hypothetical protein